jgi:deoxyribonuclease V
MPVQLNQDWNINPAEARRVQLALQEQVRQKPLPLNGVKTVGGVDASYRGDKIYAAVVVLELPGLHLVEKACSETALAFPYIPGLLSFRELPGILAAVEKLSRMPDAFLVDGHGLAHPRRFGLACHLGVLLEAPSIGCAKSLLVGQISHPSDAEGSQSWLTLDDQIIAAALRTRAHVKPVYISVGHRIDLESALAITTACLTGYRLPEPIRQAHSEARSSM